MCVCCLGWSVFVCQFVCVSMYVCVCNCIYMNVCEYFKEGDVCLFVWLFIYIEGCVCVFFWVGGDVCIPGVCVSVDHQCVLSLVPGGCSSSMYPDTSLRGWAARTCSWAHQHPAWTPLDEDTQPGINTRPGRPWMRSHSQVSTPSWAGQG